MKSRLLQEQIWNTNRRLQNAEDVVRFLEDYFSDCAAISYKKKKDPIFQKNWYISKDGINHSRQWQCDTIDGINRSRQWQCDTIDGINRSRQWQCDTIDGINRSR